MFRQKLNKKLTIGQKLKIGATIGLVVAVVVWEKKRVDELLAFTAEAFEGQKDAAFEAGLKYGLTLEKTINVVREAA